MKNYMKIAYLSSSLIPSKMANSVQVMKTCNALAACGAGVDLYARKTEESLVNVYKYYGVDDSFHIYRQDWPKIRGIGGIIYSKKVSNKIRNNELPDVIYGRDIYSLLEATKFNIPILLEAHTLPTNLYNNHLMDKITKNCNFKKLIVTADSLKKQYHKLYPWLDENQIVVIRNGADVPKVDQINSKIKIDIKTGQKLNVGYVGHLYPGKGMEIIYEIAKLTNEYQFHIVGGNDEDIEYWQKIIGTNNVVFHGFVSNERLFEFYNMFDVVIAPYQNIKLNEKDNKSVDKWASPLKIIEYMSYAKPIIASDLPMVREVLTTGFNGLLCDPKDISSWINALQSFEDDFELRRLVSVNAYKEFIENYTWKKRAERIIKECSN